jgi:hypothetical protein
MRMLRVLRRLERLEHAPRPPCHEDHVIIRWVSAEPAEDEHAEPHDAVDTEPRGRCPSCGLIVQEYVLVGPEGDDDERDDTWR